jgi:hypothetical protein
MKSFDWVEAMVATVVFALLVMFVATYVAEPIPKPIPKAIPKPVKTVKKVEVDFLNMSPSEQIELLYL